MKKVFISIFFLLIVYIISAAEFSDSLRASVLTISPGTELYSTFGHTAIRIKDLRNKNDYVFNYGTFDFETPNFYVKFALGKLDYMLSVESFNDFMAFYKEEESNYY